MIRTIGYDQHEMIADIIKLHVPAGRLEMDCTYSKGQFYKSDLVEQPLLKFDLYPQDDETQQAEASSIPLENEAIESMMFDPPFLVGYKNDNPTGIMGSRFHGFKNIKELWNWYDLCLKEYYRLLKLKGVLIFKCQDTCSSGKNWFSHVHIINEAERLGFYTKDLFVLLAKHRIQGHNHSNQKHGRKFHSYFIVLEKRAH